jgi:hypothetical protein
MLISITKTNQVPSCVACTICGRKLPWQLSPGVCTLTPVHALYFHTQILKSVREQDNSLGTLWQSRCRQRTMQGHATKAAHVLQQAQQPTQEALQYEELLQWLRVVQGGEEVAQEQACPLLPPAHAAETALELPLERQPSHVENNNPDKVWAGACFCLSCPARRIIARQLRWLLPGRVSATVEEPYSTRQVSSLWHCTCGGSMHGNHVPMSCAF